MSEAYSYAIQLLSRREYSAWELVQRLRRKGYPEATIQEEVDRCQALDLQSDLRFAEMICRTRMRQGYGPLRIRQELQAKKVAGELIEAVLLQEQEHWLACAEDVWRKKYKERGEHSTTALVKQRQFLIYRGFPMDIITQLVKT